MKFYFDPGGPCAGWAQFEGTNLFAAGLSRTKEKTTKARAKVHQAYLESLGAYEFRVLSESMAFRQGRNKGNPQDLMDVNLIAGHVGTDWVLPHEWKGMTPKEIHQPKILACLTPEERAIVDAIKPPSLRHNAIDAIGIGLWDVGRLKVTTCAHPVKSPMKRTSRSRSGGSASSARTARGATSTKKGKKSGKPSRRQSSITTSPTRIRMPVRPVPGTEEYEAEVYAA
jgi:hypothetical protein